MEFRLDRIRDDGDARAYGAISAAAFNSSAERSADYLRAVGMENIRIARLGEAVAGGLAQLPMGQFFGGRSVPMVGIASVAVAPEFRSQRAASLLMNATVQELHARGVALSTLYPATQPVYRRAGYEIAGAAFEVKLICAQIDEREKRLAVRRATPADQPAVRGLYLATAQYENGQLDRSEFIWGRVAMERGEPTQAFVVEGQAGIEGYVYYIVRAEPYAPQRMRLTDISASTPLAARRLLRFLADHRSVVESVSWFTGPADPMLPLLGEQPYQLSSRTYWMLRVTHVERALLERGYPAGANAELHLEVQDDVIAGNSGRFVLRVADGRAQLERGGRGSFALDVRGLASLYSGCADPAALKLRGLLRSGESDDAAARALFSGPTPWMRDAF